MSMRGKFAIVIIIITILGGVFIPSFIIDNTPFEENIPKYYDLASDNEHIAWVGNYKITICNYALNKEVAQFRTQLSYRQDIAWSPDSTKIAVSGFIGVNENPTKVMVYDINTLKLIFEKEYYFEDDYETTAQQPQLKWSADGKFLFGEILHSQMEFESDDYTEDSYEKHILWDTLTWDTVWEYNVPIYNGHSHAYITDTTDRVFYRTGDGKGSISISMIDPLTSVSTEFNFFENRSISSDLYINDILWGNDTTLFFIAVEYSNYLDSELFYSYNFHSEDMILLYNTSSNINEPIMNFVDGTLVTDYYSDQFNPIHSLLTQEVVYTIEHPFQDLYGQICFDMVSYPCAISVPHQWSSFSNIIAYSNYYEDTGDYELVIFDVDNSKILGIIPEL